MFFPYHFEGQSERILRLVGVRPDRDGVRIDDDRLVATFGPFTATVELSNIASASTSGPYRWIKVIGPRLSLADHGLTFGSNTIAGVCIEFRKSIPAVIGPWEHPGLTVTVQDQDGLVAAIKAKS